MTIKKNRKQIESSENYMKFPPGRSGFFPLSIVDIYGIQKSYNMDIEISGGFTDWHEPLIIIFIEGYYMQRGFCGVIDTGAYYSMIQKKIVDLIRPMPLIKEEIVIRPTFNGDLIKSPLFDLTIYFSQSEGKIKEEFGILPNNSPDFILGTSFLSKCKEFSYYGNKREYKLIL